jgi:molybdate transport system substrate-binding protein
MYYRPLLNLVSAYGNKSRYNAKIRFSPLAGFSPVLLPATSLSLAAMVRLLIFFLLLGLNASAQPLRLAVAANADAVIKRIQAEFTKSTGITTEAIVGSSGNLATQIRNGAPYDLFFSADMEFPAALQKAGFTLTAPAAYALGSLIICATGDIDLNDWKRQLLSNKAVKIAIANPTVAPYGKAAEEVLKKYTLWDKLKPKFVYGESISQVNTYITTRSVSIGFTTEALIHESVQNTGLKWVRLDQADYSKIRQGFVVLTHAKKGNQANALKFAQFISSAAAKKIFKQFGYGVL